MHEEIQKSVMEKIIVVMTEDQVKRWKEMTGAPFVGSVPMFLPGPPGPFGPLR